MIIAFPFAGGNKYSFQKIFNNSLLFNVIEYSNIMITSSENLILDSIIEDLFLKIPTSEEYIIYGHSMGSLIGYLLCQKLQEENLPMPKKLIVTGKKAPSIPRNKKIACLPDEEFWLEIIALGGIPDEMQNYPELIEYYLPILRHDFKLVESYEYENKPKLNIPIDVFYGSEEATEEEMIGWQDETTEKVTIIQLPGNHFFIFNHIEYFRTYFDNLVNQK